MSLENVEIVRSMYEAYARADFERGLSFLHPEIEFSQPEEEPGAGTYRGHEGVVHAFALGATRKPGWPWQTPR
jgi:ketosteroid isomerase-like protein